jgi:hypothetical protein
MTRRGTAPAPAAPKCAECARIRNEGKAAENDRDYSRAVDCRILFARHRAAAHPGIQ